MIDDALDRIIMEELACKRRSMPPKCTAVLSSEPTAAGQLEQVATAVENVEIANPKRLQLC